MEDNPKIWILLDYRDQFYSSSKHRGASLDWSLLDGLLVNRGYEVELRHFSDINLRTDIFEKCFVLYQSSEDPNLYYKDYIEDILLGIVLKGGILVPDFSKFRAHHNKVFMELLRDVLGAPLTQNISTHVMGTLEDLKKKDDLFYPLILKPSAGSRSKGVTLVHSKNELLRLAKKISCSPTKENILFFLRGLWKRIKYTPISNYRKKFVIQNYIPHLTGDYKILAYNDRLYVLQRKNRKGDFRASGSGIFLFPEKLPDGLLEYAYEIYKKCDTPFISMDICMVDNSFALLEMQFVTFGQYALEKAKFFFRRVEEKWKVVKEYSSLEDVFAEAIDTYILRKYRN